MADDKDQCPKGEDCSVCNRRDEEFAVEDIAYVRYITYVGEYVVVTEDNRIFDDPRVVVQAVLKLIEDPDCWETSIYFVGEGVLRDLVDMDEGVRASCLRYAKTHNEWDSIRDVHVSTVQELASGWLNVSEPLNAED